MAYGRVVERRLNRHATTVLVGGLFLSVSLVMYMSFCNMPCEDASYAMDMDDLEHLKSKAYWKKHILAPKRANSARLLIIILTTPKNMDRRDAIRNTWLKNKTDGVVHKFLVGEKRLNIDDMNTLNRESHIYDDILLLPEVQEAYTSLTKKVIEGFKWAHRKLDFQYVLKVDDDSFVQVDKFLDNLNNKPRDRLYWGFFDGSAHVYKTGKWAEPNWILCDRYLPYARGGGYVLSSDLVHFIVSNEDFLQYYISEDVSVGTWLAPLDIERVHDVLFDTEYVSRGCNNKYIVTHKQSPADMREKFKNLNENKQMCTKEIQTRKSYIYDWNVLPKECCKREDPTIP